MAKKKITNSITVAGVCLLFVINLMAQNRACKSDENTLQFVGSPIEQARCLLRPNGIGGTLGAELNRLPKPLDRLIGQPVNIEIKDVRRFLIENEIEESSLGGSLDEPLATAQLPDGSTTAALYFVIHDTSTPYLRDADFPANIDIDPSWKGNNLDVWLKNPVTHVFVNRLGRSLTTSNFSEPVKKGFGTKFARIFLGANAKGLQLHVELIQPRRRDPASANPDNDLIAPQPGFSDKQYQRLASLYLCASLRRGTWLIPAYHSAVDAGIADAHDDPQNFEVSKFASALERLIKYVR